MPNNDTQMVRGGLQKIDEQATKLVTDAFAECQLEDGWVNAAHLGSVIKTLDPNFQPTAYGFQKLAEFLTGSGLCEIRRAGLVVFAKLVNIPGQPDGEGAAIRDVRPILGRATVSVPRQLRPDSPPKLCDWAYFPKGGDLSAETGFTIAIRHLRGLALEELWDFGGSEDCERPHPILRNYLNYTFFKLWLQGDVLAQGRYASFNTGLVDSRYEPIFAFFVKNRNIDRQPWCFSAFCFAGEDAPGKLLVSHFNPLRQPAVYFEDPRSMFYDLRGGTPSVDWEHVIIENVSRLPLEFLKENAPKTFVWRESSAERDHGYFDQLAQAIRGDARSYRTIKNRMSDSLELALKRVRWNFKTAIPQYYPTRRQMSLLLPLALASDEQPDIAMVVERTASGNYLGHTLLPLMWAYNNARLVCRPDSDWLSPKLISASSVRELLAAEPADDSPE